MNLRNFPKLMKIRRTMAPHRHVASCMMVTYRVTPAHFIPVPTEANTKSPKGSRRSCVRSKEANPDTKGLVLLVHVKATLKGGAARVCHPLYLDDHCDDPWMIGLRRGMTEMSRSAVMPSSVPSPNRLQTTLLLRTAAGKAWWGAERSKSVD